MKLLFVNYRFYTLLIFLFAAGKVNAQYCMPIWSNQAGNCSGADLITNVNIAGTVLDHDVTSCNGTSRYKDFTGNTPAILYKNSGYNTYTLSVTTNFPSGGSISVWIDLNQDSTFSSWEWWQVSNNTTQNVASAINITIPDTALLGSTVMRIRTRTANNNGSGDACSQFHTGVAYDYNIIIDSMIQCSGAPAAGNVFAPASVCNGNTFCLAAVNGSMGLGQVFQWQYSSDNVVWNNIMNSNKYYIYSVQNAPTYYRYYTSCSNATDTAPSTLVNSKKCYCSASANSAQDDDIGSFKMGAYFNGKDTLPALNNSMAASTYSDYTNKTFGTFFKGKTYSSKITQINSNAFFYACYAKVFIDFNQNGTFEAGETVDSGQTASGYRYVDGNIYIPTTAKTGYTLMRVVLRENGTNNSTTACGNFSYGEVEDYTILILEQTSKDISMTEFVSPKPALPSCSGNSNQTIEVKFQNTGYDTVDFSVDTLKVRVSVDLNGSVSTLTSTINSGTLPPLSYKTIILSNSYNMSNVGIYNFKAWSQLTADTVPINDSVDGPEISIQQIISPSSTTPYFEDFEKGSGMWSSGGIYNSWELGTPTKSVIDTSSSGGSQCWTTSLTTSYNYNERSYLQSPCFDLSNMDSLNTVVSFDIWWNCERDYDGATFQYSTDDGATWTRLGDYGSVNNWYNDTVITTASVQNFIDGPHCWSGRNSSYDGSGGWVKAQYLLPDYLFSGTVKFRFAFASDYAVVDDGIAIDNFSIRELPPIDAAVTKLVLPIATPCKNNKQDITVQILNAGTDTLDMSATSLKINVMVANAGSGNFTKTFNSGVILPGSTRDFVITNNFNMNNIGTYNFKVFCYTANDGNRNNDTNIFIRSTSTALSLPEFQSFDGIIAGGYTGSTNVALNSGSGIGGSKSLRMSVNSTTPYAVAQTPNFGTIGKNTVIKFDYRFSTTLSSDDSVKVYISIDCGVTYKSIYIFNNSNTSNTSYKTFQYDLGQYFGNNVTAMIEGRYGSINFMMDIDNFAIDDKPNVNLGNDTAVCEMLMLNADPQSNGWLVKWSNGSNTDTNTVFNTNTYWAKVTDLYTGIYNYDTIKVDVYAFPSFNLGKDTAVCSGSNYMLSAGKWSNDYKFLWSTGDTTSSIMPKKSGDYIAFVFSPGGCIASDTVHINVNPGPTGTALNKGNVYMGSYNSGTSTNPDGVCTTNTISYEILPPAQYNNSQYGSSWKFATTPSLQTASGGNPSNGTVIYTAPGAQNASLSFSPSAAEAGNVYILSVTVLDLTSGCDTTMVRYIAVSSNSPISLGADKNICEGDTFILDAGPANTYIWNTGETTQTIAITKAGSYSVALIKNGGCSSSDTINIGVLAAPNSNFNVTLLGKTLTASPIDGSLNGYSWDFGDGGQSNLKNTSHIYATDGLYSVSLKVTDGNGCRSTTVKNLNLNSDVSEVSTNHFQASVSPNPYNNNAVLNFSLNETKNLKIDIYDMSGKLINTLCNGPMASGLHQVNIYTESNGVGAGMYYVRILVENQVYNIKIVDLGK